MIKREGITESSGNVFEDLGFEKAEAESLLLRARIMLNLEKHLRESKMTQTELGAVLQIGQPRVSDLLKRKAKLFSLDMLVTLATRIGIPVTLSIKGPLQQPRQESGHVFIPTFTTGNTLLGTADFGRFATTSSASVGAYYQPSQRDAADLREVRVQDLVNASSASPSIEDYVARKHHQRIVLPGYAARSAA